MIGVQTTQSSVFANRIPVARLGDPARPHTILRGKRCVGHPARVNAASRTVFAQGIRVARIGDSYDQGKMLKGSLNVISN